MQNHHGRGVIVATFELKVDKAWRTFADIYVEETEQVFVTELMVKREKKEE